MKNSPDQKLCSGCGRLIPRPNWAVFPSHWKRIRFCSKACRNDAIGKSNSVPLAERMARFTNKTTECWLWLGAIKESGYAQIKLAGRSPMVHRVSYELAKGPIPAGLQLDHLCRVRNCINPDHLEAVTAAENVRRGTSVPGVNARKIHCKRGHQLSGLNLRIVKNGRECKICSRAAVRQWEKINRPTKASAELAARAAFFGVVILLLMVPA